MIVYICSPLRGDPPYTDYKTKRNLLEAAEHCKNAAKAGHTPIAPHLYFNGFLNDRYPDQRRLGMKMGNELLRLCAEVWVFGKLISEGMKNEIALANEIGIPVIYK